MGASPRGTLGLLHAAQALAALDGRDYVGPDDIKAVAVPVLAHRLLLRTELWGEGRESADVIAECLDTISAPDPAPDPAADH